MSARRQVHCTTLLGLIDRMKALVAAPVIPADCVPRLLPEPWPQVTEGPERRHRLGYVYIATVMRWLPANNDWTECLKIGFTAYPVDRVRVLLAEPLLLISGCQIHHESAIHRALREDCRGLEVFEGKKTRDLLTAGRAMAAAQFGEFQEGDSLRMKLRHLGARSDATHASNSLGAA